MSDRGQNIRELVRRAVRAGTAPAVLVAWNGRPDGEISGEHFGSCRVVPARVGVSPETWFDLASLTKPLVTTTLALIAFRSGVIAAKTRVGEVLSEIRGSDFARLEVRQILTHTAGLPAWLPLYCLAEGRPDGLIPRLAEIRLEARPGARVIYSCVGFVALGLMLARVAGENLDALFQREVLDALGLNDHLGFNIDYATHSLCGGADRSVVEQRMIRDLGLDPRYLPAAGFGLPDDGNARFLHGVSGNAGLFGTARGVIKLASEYLPGGGSLLTAGEKSWATSLQTKGLEQARGLGWQLASTPGCSAGEALSEASFGHTGFTGVSVWCDPEARSCLAMMTNRNHPSQRENDLHALRRKFHAMAVSR